MAIRLDGPLPLSYSLDLKTFARPQSRNHFVIDVSLMNRAFAGDYLHIGLRVGGTTIDFNYTCWGRYHWSMTAVECLLWVRSVMFVCPKRHVCSIMALTARIIYDATVAEIIVSHLYSGVLHKLPAPRVWNSLPHTITDDLNISAPVLNSFLYRRSYQYQ